MTAKTKGIVKKILIVVAILAGIAILYKVFTSLFGKSGDGGKDESKNLGESISKEIKNLSKRMSPSFPDSSYIGFADKLQEAMEGSGTDTGVVLSTFNVMQNDLDVAKLIQAFGIRSPKAGVLFKDAPPQELSGWISAEGRTYFGLGAPLTDKVNDSLKQRGTITYRF